MLNKKSVITLTMLLSLGLGGASLAQCPGANVPAPGERAPERLAGAAGNCPGLEQPAPNPGAAAPGNLPEAAQNCPGLNGRPGPEAQMAARADARMRKIAKALEGNKRTSDSLIRAAAEAGVEPHVLDDMEQLSQAFREMFMAAVPPQQILESLLATPPAGEEQGGIVITAPDGSQWLITPQGRPDAPLRPQGRPPQMGKGPRPIPGAAPEMNAAPRLQPGLLPPPEALRDPSLRMAPPAAVQPPAPAWPDARRQPGAVSGAVAPHSEARPCWPAGQLLDKEKILKYWEKRRDNQ